MTLMMQVIRCDAPTNLREATKNRFHYPLDN